MWEFGEANCVDSKNWVKQRRQFCTSWLRKHLIAWRIQLFSLTDFKPGDSVGAASKILGEDANDIFNINLNILF